MRRSLLISSLAIAWLGGSITRAAQQRPFEYVGMCDSSAAVTLDGSTFVVASDEDNVLRVYRRGQAHSINAVDTSAFLAVDRKEPETDIEGAARVGDIVYWISSHSRNKNAKERPNRYRFFATNVKTEGQAQTVETLGAPYKNLLRDMLREASLAPFGLANASLKAPEAEGGLNIEGLARRPDGSLLIAFHNPVPGGKALLLPLENPADVTRNQTARFGPPLTLDLGGLGVRSIEYVEQTQKYLIAAGPIAHQRPARIYEWTGRPADAPVHLTAWDGEIVGLNPEAIIVYPPTNQTRPVQIDILSDDGWRKMDGKECKSLKDPSQQKFRGIRLSLP